ncbi:MAG: hypothetical protein R6V77_05305 [Candidatus Cloacimonadaceae bacterium]
MRGCVLLIVMTGLLLAGCATHSYLPYYNTSAWDSFYQGGDGSSTETAIIINTEDDKKIEDAERHYLDNVINREGRTYTISSESDYTQDGRVFNIIRVMLDNDTIRDYHFDISIPYRAALEK